MNKVNVNDNILKKINLKYTALVTAGVIAFGSLTACSTKKQEPEDDVISENQIQLIVEYKVQPGDSVYYLAGKFGCSMDDIKDHNRFLYDNSTLYLGKTVLNCPIVLDNPDGAIKTYGEYIVQPGDTLTSIAKKAQCSINTLVNYNHIADPDIIAVDDVLKYPLKFRAYIIRPGDTIITIMQKFDVSLEILEKYNSGQTLRDMKEGSVIVFEDDINKVSEKQNVR